MDYIVKVAKRRGLYHIREKKMDIIMKRDKMIKGSLDYLDPQVLSDCTYGFPAVCQTVGVRWNLTKPVDHSDPGPEIA